MAVVLEALGCSAPLGIAQPSSRPSVPSPSEAGARADPPGTAAAARAALYTQLAEEELIRGQGSAAALALSEALRQDPTNARARALLEYLLGAWASGGLVDVAVAMLLGKPEPRGAAAREAVGHLQAATDLAERAGITDADLLALHGFSLGTSDDGRAAWTRLERAQRLAPWRVTPDERREALAAAVEGRWADAVRIYVARLAPLDVGRWCHTDPDETPRVDGCPEAAERAYAPRDPEPDSSGRPGPLSSRFMHAYIDGGVDGNVEQSAAGAPDALLRAGLVAVQHEVGAVALVAEGRAHVTKHATTAAFDTLFVGATLGLGVPLSALWLRFEYDADFALLGWAPYGVFHGPRSALSTGSRGVLVEVSYLPLLQHRRVDDVGWRSGVQHVAEGAFAAFVTPHLALQARYGVSLERPPHLDDRLVEHGPGLVAVASTSKNTRLRADLRLAFRAPLAPSEGEAGEAAGGGSNLRETVFDGAALGEWAFAPATVAYLALATRAAASSAPALSHVRVSALVGLRCSWAW